MMIMLNYERINGFNFTLIIRMKRLNLVLLHAIHSQHQLLRTACLSLHLDFDAIRILHIKQVNETIQLQRITMKICLFCYQI